jgi:hypothetical protein
MPEPKRHKWYMSKLAIQSGDKTRPRICCLCGVVQQPKMPPCAGIPADAEASARMRQTY